MRAQRLGMLIGVVSLLASATARAAPTVTKVVVGGGTINLTLDPDGTPDPVVLDWVRRAAGALTAFYGHFPVESVRIDIERVSGRGIFGTTYGSARIAMRLGENTSPAQLAHDWTLTHEMFHLAFPDLDRQHLWMEEGMATYFEPIARVRTADITAERVWNDLLEGLPKGLPRDGDRGLDRTPTWGRTYWGGALFWFLADMEIREQTHGHRSADDALRAILAAGGRGGADWSIARVLAVGDQGTGTTVLASLYKRMATEPYPVDIAAFAAKLGIGPTGTYDDKAPEADIRRAITNPDENKRR